MQKMGQVDGPQTCKNFCRDLYNETCNWFMYYRTSYDCKLYNASLNNLHRGCRELGHGKEPNHDSCNQVFEDLSSSGCYVSSIKI